MNPAFGRVRRSLALLALVFHLSTRVDGQIFYDSFSYSEYYFHFGGGGHGWINRGGAAAIVSGSLHVPGLLPSRGNHFQTGSDDRGEIFYHPIGSHFSGSLYFSAALRVDRLYGNPSIDPWGLRPRSDVAVGFEKDDDREGVGIILRPDDDGFNLGITKEGIDTLPNDLWDNQKFLEGETLFVVGRYTFVPGANNNDTIAGWINPAPSTFGATQAPAPTLEMDFLSPDYLELQNISLSGYHGPRFMSLDEVRVGNSWADVTPVPELNSFSFFAALILLFFAFARQFRSKRRVRL